MKVEIKDEKVFKPIELKVTIESENELLSLLAALNTNNMALVNNNVVQCSDEMLDYQNYYDLYSDLKDAIRDKGYTFK